MISVHIPVHYREVVSTMHLDGVLQILVGSMGSSTTLSAYRCRGNVDRKRPTGLAKP
jgi:hypothetical protein